MKKILYTLFSAGMLLATSLFTSNGTFQVGVESPTPTVSPTLVPPPGVETTPVDGPTPIPTLAPAEAGDPYGELYFTVTVPDFASQTDPNILLDTYITRLVRIPGSCVVGLIECPAPNVVSTPFDLQDVLAIDSDSGALIWSPDGRYGVITIHPPDDITKGWTAEEWEQFKTRKLEDLNISPSTLYLFDAETDTWRALYSADRKFFHSSHWSPDGQWIAFTVSSSLITIHPSQPDDGVYIVHPDGSDLQLLGGEGYILGWVGDSIITRRSLDPASGSFAHVVEKVSLDGQVTKLFESSRLASYSLAHDGGSLLAADGATREGGNPVKEINVLALDGSEIRSFGALSNRTSAIFPFVWSPDGTQVAFANLRRLYVAPRVSQLDIPSGIVGVPPDSREVYVASDEFVTPFFTDLEFSRDNKFLVMQVYEGDTHFVVVSLETGQATPLAIPHLDPFVVDDNYLGTPAFFSWRQ